MPGRIESLKALEIANWQINLRGEEEAASKEEIIEDLASFTIEARESSLAQKVNTVVVSLTEFSRLENIYSQDPIDIATSKIIAWRQTTTPFVQIETETHPPCVDEILAEIQDSGRSPKTVMILISPSKEGFYKGTRIYVYKAIDINGSPHLDFWGICGEQTGEECLSLARNLLPFVKKSENFIPPTNTEELRATPLPIVIPQGQDLISFLRELITMPEVWEAILKGDSWQEKKRAVAAASQIVEEHYEEIINAKGSDEKNRVGMIVEKKLRRRLGIVRFREDDCGGLYENSSETFLGKEAKFVQKCGQCGVLIMRHISPGYICQCCGGVYQGC